MDDRNADYEWHARVTEVWSADENQSPFGNGNLASHLIWTEDGSKWVGSNERPAWGSCQSMYQRISSELLLYRLACTFPATVHLLGQAGYKAVWWVGVVHKSGARVGFSEWKGASGFWSDFSSMDDPRRGELPTPELLADLKDLIDYLVSDVCAHPYDGLVAGNIA